MRRALIALAAGVAVSATWMASSVEAAAVSDTGWWDRNGDALLPSIDPPPEEAIRVANDPAGTRAIAAVRFSLDEGEDRPSLVLRVESDPVPEGAAFVACPTTSEWTAARGAPLSEAPEPDCEAGAALGFVAADGTSVSFDLGQIARDRVVDVVISPSPEGESPIADTFTVDFLAPDASDVTTSAAPSATPAAPSAAPPPAGGGAAAPPPASGGGAPSFTPSPSGGGGFSGPASPAVTVPDGSTGGGAPLAGGATPIVDSSGDEVAVPPLGPVTSSSKRWVGLATAAAILALGAYLWRADRARAAMTAGPVLGGLGPFVRERTGRAPDVA